MTTSSLFFTFLSLNKSAIAFRVVFGGSLLSPSHFLTKDDHGLDFCLQNDVVLDDGLVEVDNHVLADDNLPFSAVFLLDRLLQSWLKASLL